MANKETTVKSKLKINYATKTQIDKAPSLSETEMYIVDPEYAGNKVLVTDRKADIVESIVTDAELETIHGISGNIQEQLNEEKEARIAKDTELRNDLDAEVQRATDQDNAHTDVINTLTANLTTEIERSTQRDNELTNALSAEELRAKGIEEGLRTDLGNPANLTTTSKTNTVSAINELNANKQNNITGAITTVLDTDLVGERVVISNANGKVAVSDITINELNQLDGATSNIQTQITNEVNARTQADTALTTQVNELDQKIDAETTARTTADTELGTRITNEVTRATAADTELGTRITTVSDNLASEVTARTDADTALQEQIDAITSKSDVVDVVSTKAALDNYDISKLNDNDVIKVLKDESQSNATTYYRWNASEEKFTFIGAEGPYYTVTEADNTFVPKTLTVNNKALNQNITLTYSDVNALSDTTSINDLTTTTQQNALNSGITSAGVTQITTNKNAIGTLSSLATTNKNNLVNAVNELNTNKQANISGAASTITSDDLTVNRALISNANGKVAVSNVTNTELGYISGVTSSVQTQLNAKANDADISAVGKSNDYEDLDNKPTIGNATITFKANGATITGQSFTTNATSNVEIDLGNTGLVDDVKVNNTSIVTNKIANIPVASTAGYGVVKVNTNKGITASSGQLETIAATTNDIIGKTNQYKVLTPSNLDVAIVQGLSNNANTMTDDQQSDTRDFIGATQVILNDWS